MYNELLWSDNWWVEKDLAWFVAAEINALFNVNLKTEQCDYVVDLPRASEDVLRNCPKCMKVGQQVWCFPDRGENILIYNIKHNSFDRINIPNPLKKRIVMRYFWKRGDRVYAISCGLYEIFEIDINDKKIIDTYKIANIESEKIGECILTEDCIYTIVSSSKEHKLYELSLKTKGVSCYTLPKTDTRLYTISYDGEKFWFSGKKREIFVWEKGSAKFTALNAFPPDFGHYNFEGKQDMLLDCNSMTYEVWPFFFSAFAGGRVWFIPYQTNHILYVNKDTYEIKAYEIQDEMEQEEDLKRHLMPFKYLFEYVREERYLGLYSLKNRCYFEIDALHLEKKQKWLKLNPKAEDLVNRYICNINEPRILSDKIKKHRQLFDILLDGVAADRNENTEKAGNNATGKMIYTFINTQED